MAATLAAALRSDGVPGIGDAGLRWLHAFSDAGIAIAFFAIAGSLIWFVRQKRDVPFSWLYQLCALFLVSCGANHVLGAWNLWNADYWIEGFAKTCTAVFALAAAAALIRAIPQALRLRSVDELEQLNQSLEARVADRTKALAETNEFLRAEIRVRRSAEAAVRDLNERLTARLQELEALFRVLPIGVGISNDPSCRQIQVNPAFARMLGIDPGSNASMSAPLGEAPTSFEVWHDGRRLSPTELPMQTAARENREVRNFEEKITHRDGESIHVIGDAVPLHTPDGRVRGVVGAFRDVTALHRATEERVAIERRLLETQKLESVGMLAAGIAHDFNNMLAIVNSSAELAGAELSDDDGARAHLTAISETVDRAADLCRQLLAYAGQGRFEVGQHDLNRILRDTVSLLQGARFGMHRMTMDLAAALPPITGDGTQLRQVVLNIITNAAEACPETGGHIRISSQPLVVDESRARTTIPAGALRPGPCVHLQVVDSGTGMDEETLGKIFLPFFTTKFTGRGLGLAAVLGIVRSHGGGVRVSSTPDVGTTFDVFLPAAASPAEETPPSPTPDRAAAAPRVVPRLSGRVLVTDDEAALRRSLSNMLRLIGLEVVTACDGVEALTCLAQSGPFDLVLLDVTMPRMGGYETLTAIRKEFAQLPVVIMSGYSEHDVGVQFRDLQPAGILPKPFHLAELIETLQPRLSRAST